MSRKIYAQFVAILSLLVIGCSAYAGKPNPTFYFVAMSDIHFDPFITCYNKRERPCAVIKKLQAAPANQWKAILAEADTGEPSYRLDTNYQLLQANLSAAKKAATKNKADFVLVLGDTLGHDFRRYYRKYAKDRSHAGFQRFVKKTLQFINAELSATFPDISVFMVVGNNDTYSWNYQSVPNGAFFHDTAALWSELIKNPQSRSSMKSMFVKGGYYAVDLPNQPRLRLIVLNSVLFSKRSRYKSAMAEATRELNWFHQEMKQAKKNGQKVIIALHIPTTAELYITKSWHLLTLIEFWRPKYIERFQQILSDYYPQVATIFSGHLHYDWSQPFNVGLRRNIPVVGVPSISPFFGNEPSFKVYHYSSVDSQIDDHYTYYFPMSGRGTWSVEHVYDLLSKHKI